MTPDMPDHRSWPCVTGAGPTPILIDAALVSDGLHARTDGLTSQAIAVGAVAALLGFPLADPIERAPGQD
jgi:hypothetical protein